MVSRFLLAVFNGKMNGSLAFHIDRDRLECAANSWNIMASLIRTTKNYLCTEELGTISPPILKLQSEEGTRCGCPCFSLLNCVSNLEYSVSSTANSESKVTIIIYKSDITTVYKDQPRIKPQSERE